MRSDNARLLAPMVRCQVGGVFPAARSQSERSAPTVLLSAAFGPLVPCAFIDTMIGPPETRRGQNLATSTLSNFVPSSSSRLSQTIDIQCAARTRRGSQYPGRLSVVRRQPCPFTAPGYLQCPCVIRVGGFRPSPSAVDYGVLLTMR